MKRIITALLFGAVTAIAATASAQCTFISPTVEINTTTIAGANCIVDFNLAFDIITNSGNKIIYLHLWQDTAYPNHNYGCNQCQPTYSVNDHNGKQDLANTVLDIAIDNFGGTPVFLTSYGPDPTTPIQSPANNPAMTITRTASTTAGADRFIISHVIATVPGACTNSIIFKGDAWSSNANSANAAVQCSMEGFSVGLTDPAVSGLCLNSVPGQYRFNISTVSPSRQVYYDVYLDNGNGILDPANDSLLSSVPITNAITITPSTPFISDNIDYPSQAYSVTRKVYVVVATVGESYLISAEITPCSGMPLPVTMESFSAIRKNGGLVTLNWQTGSEDGVREFVPERSSGDGFVPLGAVAATNKASGNSYSFNDWNVSKGMNYYRIKVVNMDGTVSYSSIKTVKGTDNAFDVTVFPNPAYGTAQVTIGNITGPVTVYIIDNAGRVIRTVAPGNKGTVSLDGLAQGIYLVRVIDATTGAAVTKTLAVIN